MVTGLFEVVIGLISLAAGRKLYWFFCGAAGFVVGLILGDSIFGEQEIWLRLGLGILLGVIGSTLAVFLQRALVFTAGFIAGCLAVSAGLSALNIQMPVTVAWIPFLVGGLICAGLLAGLYGWGLIVLSSIVGAYLVLQGVGLAGAGAALIFIGLVMMGVAVQGRLIRNRPAPRKHD